MPRTKYPAYHHTRAQKKRQRERLLAQQQNGQESGEQATPDRRLAVKKFARSKAGVPWITPVWPPRDPDDRSTAVVSIEHEYFTREVVKIKKESRRLPRAYDEYTVRHGDGEYYRAHSDRADSELWYDGASDIMSVTTSEDHDEGYASEDEGQDASGDDPKDETWQDDWCREKGDHVMVRQRRDAAIACMDRLANMR